MTYRPIPDIFIPKHRPKPEPLRQPSTTSSERRRRVAALEAAERHHREIERLMRTNTCPWL